MKMVVLDGYTLNPGDNPWDEVAELGELVVYDHTPAPQVPERAREADILLTNKTLLTARTLARLPRLKFVSVLATGFNVVDVKACRARGIPVSNVPGYATDAVAQYVFALVLELCHHVAHHDQRVKAGEWRRRGAFSFWDVPLVELSGLTLAVVGFGRIGRRTAEVAHALGMRVIAHAPVPGSAPPYEPFSWVTLPDAFALADVVSLHCTLTPANAGFVNDGLLGLMKSTAFLVNTARGGLVDEAALARALNTHGIAGAAVDVVSEEPIRPDNPLLGARNILITPHMAWATLAARRRLMTATAENIRAYQAGAPVHVVN